MRTIAVWNYRFQFGNVSFPRAEKFAIERFSLEMSRFHALAPKSLELHFFFSVQRLHGFRQVVQHVQLHAAK